LKSLLKQLICFAAIAGMMLPSSAYATNGYFSDGYGMKAKGMGGAGIAYPQDSIAAATNPAGMVWLGNRTDVGLDFFSPDRDSNITGNGMVNGSFDGNDKSLFIMPEFGYNRMITDKTAFGVSLFGNGGMNSSYTSAIPLFGTTKAGVDLSQAFLAATWSFKVAENESFGISPYFAYQRFKATGLQNFDNATWSSAPGFVTDNGYDASTGFGVRVGWLKQLSRVTTVGATYQTKTSMSRFDKYKGLFAEQGSFDIPENYGLGFAFKVNPKVDVAVDVVRINYGGVDSIANSLLTGAQMGSSNGPGFGWQDETVYKLGIAYRPSDSLVYRFGYNYGKQPIPADQTLLNILAPATVEQHITLGATWTLSKDRELTVAYMHAFGKTISGSNSIPASFGGGEANLEMHEDSLGVAFGWKY
jgi:long-chain fatty acid transport protein